MLVPMRNLLDKATIEGYGVVAPNVINECTARVCIEAAEACTADLGCRLCISPGFGFSGAYAGRNSCSIIRPYCR